MCPCNWPVSQALIPKQHCVHSDLHRQVMWAPYGEIKVEDRACAILMWARQIIDVSHHPFAKNWSFLESESVLATWIVVMHPSCLIAGGGIISCQLWITEEMRRERGHPSPVHWRWNMHWRLETQWRNLWHSERILPSIGLISRAKTRMILPTGSLLARLREIICVVETPCFPKIESLKSFLELGYNKNKCQDRGSRREGTSRRRAHCGLGPIMEMVAWVMRVKVGKQHCTALLTPCEPSMRSVRKGRRPLWKDVPKYWAWPGSAALLTECNLY